MNRNENAAVGRRLSRGLAVVLIAAAQFAAPIGLAQEMPAAVPSGLSEEVRAYCTNIADAARDQRYLLQAKELQDLQGKVDERIKLLEQRSEEYREWMKRREEFLRVAEGTLVDIYKNMRPDAAAEQLELVHPEIAAAIIMKLNARLASQILNEMAAEKAAGLTGIIADAANTEQPKGRS